MCYFADNSTCDVANINKVKVILCISAWVSGWFGGREGDKLIIYQPKQIG